MSSTHPNSPLSASVISTASTLPAHPRSANGYRFSTLCTTVDNPDANHQDRHGSSSVPIYQSATFKGMDGNYDYSRSGNPSRTFLEHHVAKIGSAKHAFAVTSGMGALDIILRTLKPGDEIIAGNDLYGGSNRLLAYLGTHGGIITHHIDTTSISSLTPLLLPGSKVRMVLLESPTNPLLQIVDIEEISKQVKLAIPEAIVVVDNTMMSPYLMRPLEFGADIVYDSGTKYLSGHHDLMAGLVLTNSDSISKQLKFIINSIGNGLAPFDCFLLLRGIKTLALRLDRQQFSAIKVANYLDGLGFKVNYPGLPNHLGKEIHDRIASGPGAVLSFETNDSKLSEKILSCVRLWAISVSFGCVNSLISMPCLMSHASIAPEVRKARKLPEDLIRLCVGIEDADDLLEDLQSALLEAGAIRLVDETCLSSGFERVSCAQSRSLTFDEGMNIPKTLLVSAPGKIILFGEHSVVYGKKALAAAVDLRCYCLVEPSSNHSDSITLKLPDSNFEASWLLSELPFQARSNLIAPKELDPALSGSVLSLVRKTVDKPTLVQAAHAFLYLFVHLAQSPARRAQVYTIRSALPVGAGLGSSAAYAVSISTALLSTHFPKISEAEITNGWAFVGEMVLHGNPSGVDNTVSTYGGAIGFRKSENINDKAKVERLNSFTSLDLLITDTKVPRDTKALVKSVAKRKEDEPDYICELINQLEEITLKAEDSFQDEEKLKVLIVEAHQTLCSLGVGHSALERVSKLAKELGLVTKLTGAGGGGCAITLLTSGFKYIQELEKSIQGEGFFTYRTRVGGKGVAICKQVGIKVIDHLKKNELLKKEIVDDGNESDWIYII